MNLLNDDRELTRIIPWRGIPFRKKVFKQFSIGDRIEYSCSGEPFLVRPNQVTVEKGGKIFAYYPDREVLKCGINGKCRIEKKKL